MNYFYKEPRGGQFETLWLVKVSGFVGIKMCDIMCFDLPILHLKIKTKYKNYIFIYLKGQRIVLLFYLF